MITCNIALMVYTKTYNYIQNVLAVSFNRMKCLSDFLDNVVNAAKSHNYLDKYFRVIVLFPLTLKQVSM